MQLPSRLRALIRLPNVVDELDAKLERVSNVINEHAVKLERVSNVVDELDAKLDRVSNVINEHAAKLSDVINEHAAGLNAKFERFSDVANEHAVGADAKFDRLDQLGSENRSELERVREHVGEELSRVAKEQSQAKDQLTHVTGQLENVTTIASETRNHTIHVNTSLHTRLNTIEHDRLGAFYEQMHDLTAAMLRLRADIQVGRSDRVATATEQYAPAQHHSLEADLRRAENEYPRLYEMWAERLEGMRTASQATKKGNVAHVGDSRSEAFRSFVELHAAGRVLDVGCGPFGRPFYLTSYPGSLLSGIDPLEPFEPPDFEFVRGIQEYLPWPNGAFSTVVSATALDHCLSLDRSLAEIRRVLSQEGKFLLWIDSVPGSPPFAPEAADFEPADQYHLFHFDTVWFEPMLDRWFDTLDRIEFRGLQFNRVMYSLRLREPST